MSFVPLSRLVLPTCRPFFGGYKRAVNETFAQIKPASVIQVSGLTYYLFFLTWCNFGTIYSQ